MTFTYTNEICRCYDPMRDKFYDEGYDFKYEPEEEDVIEALAVILINRANGKETNSRELNSKEFELAVDIVKQVIVDHELLEKLKDEYHFELKEMFKEEALMSECNGD